MAEDRIEDAHARKLLPELLNRSCAWCGREAWMRLRAAVQTGWYVLDPRHGDKPFISGLYECSGCERPSLATFMAYWVSDWVVQILEVIPAARATVLGLPDSEIDADRTEAWACYHAGQYRAAILMARSALQRAVRSLDPFRSKLQPELDNLLEKGLITSQLRANVDEVRLSGNDVAHPEELGTVSETDAKDSLTFLDDFLTTTIMIPERQRQRQRAREDPPSP